MVATLFTNAKSVATVTAPSGKKEKKLQATIDGLGSYGVYDAVEKAVKALKETQRTVVEPQVIDTFVDEGMKLGRQPENFKGEDFFRSNKVTASCELRKRGAGSPLNDLEVQVCEKYKIEVEDKVIVPEAYIFNPAYMGDSKLMEAVSKAVLGIKGIPSDLVIKQEEVKKKVTTENSLDQVLAIKDEKVVRQLLSIVGTVALKPNVEKFELKEALQAIIDQIKIDEEASE